MHINCVCINVIENNDISSEKEEKRWEKPTLKQQSYAQLNVNLSRKTKIDFFVCISRLAMRESTRLMRTLSSFIWLLCCLKADIFQKRKSEREGERENNVTANYASSFQH